MSSLRAENAVLRQTVEELLQETVTLRAAELENRELRDQLRYSRENPGQDFLPAEVIAFDSSMLLGTVVINRGAEASIEDGMTVALHRRPGGAGRRRAPRRRPRCC